MSKNPIDGIQAIIKPSYHPLYLPAKPVGDKNSPFLLNRPAPGRSLSDNHQLGRVVWVKTGTQDKTLPAIGAEIVTVGKDFGGPQSHLAGRDLAIGLPRAQVLAPGDDCAKQCPYY